MPYVALNLELNFVVLVGPFLGPVEAAYKREKSCPHVFVFDLVTIFLANSFGWWGVSSLLYAKKRSYDFLLFIMCIHTLCSSLKVGA